MSTGSFASLLELIKLELTIGRNTIGVFLLLRTIKTNYDALFKQKTQQEELAQQLQSATINDGASNQGREKTLTLTDKSLNERIH